MTLSLTCHPCLVLIGSLAIAACAAPPAGDSARLESVRGWYVQTTAGDQLLPCGGGEPRRLGATADLHARASTFGLEPGTPVYVELAVKTAPADTGDPRQLNVGAVTQFGSPTPVRDCALTGVVNQKQT